MAARRYTEEFESEAVKQVIERGHSASEVASRLGVSAWSLGRWVKELRVPEDERVGAQEQSAEIRRLKAEFKRVTEERDILEKAAAYFARASG